MKYISNYFTIEQLQLIENCLRNVIWELGKSAHDFVYEEPIINMNEKQYAEITHQNCNCILKKIENLIPDRKFYEEWDCHEIDIFFTKEEVEFIIKVSEISINIHQKEDFKQHLKISIEEEIGLLINHLKSLI